MKTVYLDMQESLSDDFRFFVQRVVQKKPFILIVTAEWCGHCQHFKSEALNQALKKLKAQSHKKIVKTKSSTNGKKDKVGGQTNNNMADVYLVHLSDETMRDVTNNAHNVQLQLVKELLGEVRGYPTAIAVSSRHGGQMGVMHYDGERTGNAFAQFVTEAAKH